MVTPGAPSLEKPSMMRTFLVCLRASSIGVLSNCAPDTVFLCRAYNDVSRTSMDPKMVGTLESTVFCTEARIGGSVRFTTGLAYSSQLSS